MNKEILKAIKDKEAKHSFRKWWYKNGYKVMRVVLFPIWIYIVISDKIKEWNYNRIEWNEKRADEILSYYIPKASEWDSKEKCFDFFDNGNGWYFVLAKKYLKIKDYGFWRKFSDSAYGGEIRKYLINKFELDGFIKEVGDCRDYTEIMFKMIDK